MHAAVDLAHCLRESASMVWETMWALVLGFGLSGVIQSFVPKGQMQRLLGGHDARHVARATLLGAASSSCSYAAAAMAKSLVQRGADIVSSMVFMIASTNLVVELGAVLWALVGWQFAAAEFLGGILMIAMFGLAAPRALGTRVLERARSDLAPRTDTETEAPELEGGYGRRRLATTAGWADAAAYALADLRMLRREIAGGFLIAGVVAVLVPEGVWRVVFVSGHGWWTSVENAAVGPAVAIASFVCSVGNIPLAAALWHGGIGFGGVISFVFADLITLPLLLIYRRCYGMRLTARLLPLLWVVMSLSGLIVEELFRAAGLLPVRRAVLPGAGAFHSTATLALNSLFALVALALWLLARNRLRLGGSVDLSIDPVCGMQVQVAQAPAQTRYHGTLVSFCSDGCARRFARSPERYIRDRALPTAGPSSARRHR